MNDLGFSFWFSQGSFFSLIWKFLFYFFLFSCGLKGKFFVYSPLSFSIAWSILLSSFPSVSALIILHIMDMPVCRLLFSRQSIFFFKFSTESNRLSYQIKYRCWRFFLKSLMSSKTYSFLHGLNVFLFSSFSNTLLTLFK